MNIHREHTHTHNIPGVQMKIDSITVKTSVNGSFRERDYQLNPKSVKNEFK